MGKSKEAEMSNEESEEFSDAQSSASEQSSSDAEQSSDEEEKPKKKAAAKGKAAAAVKAAPKASAKKASPKSSPAKSAKGGTKRASNSSSTNSPSPSKKAKAAAPASSSSSSSTPNSAKPSTSSISATLTLPTRESDIPAFVAAYLIEQNRPYNCQSLFDQFHSNIKKPSIQRALEQCVSDQSVVQKEFGKNILYYANQANAAVDKEEMAALVTETDKLQQQLDALKSSNNELDASVKALMREPTEAGLTADIAQFTKELQASEARLASIQKSNGNSSSSNITAQILKVQTDFNRAYSEWRLRRNSCRNITDQVSEGAEVKHSDLMRMLGIDDDASANVKIEDYQKLFKDKTAATTANGNGFKSFKK